MEKTFVQNLWEKKPDLVSQKIKEICNIDEEKGDKLQFSELKDGALKFINHGHVSIFIVASDFAIRTSYSGNDYENSKLSKKWANFMYSVYGNKYAMQYISKRYLLNLDILYIR